MCSTMLPIKKDFLPIGLRVTIHKEAHSLHNGDNISTFTIRCNKTGQIVGGSYLREGVLEFENNYENENTYCKGIRATSQKFVYLIREGFTNKPIKAFPEDISTNTIQSLFERYIPFRKKVG